MHFFRNDSLFKISVDTALFTGQKAPDKYINIVQTEPQSGLLYVYGGGGNLYYLNEATGRFVKVNGLGQSISLQRFEKNLLLTDLFNNAVYLIQGKTLLKCIEKHKSVYDPGFSFVYLDAKTAVWAFKTGDTIATNTGFASPNLNLHFQKPSKQGLYFGTEQGLITLFINGFRYFTKDEVPQAWGVTEDKTGHIWISNYAYPLQRYNGQTLEAVRGYGPPMVQKLKKMNVAIEDEAQTNGWYFNPVRDKHGKLWFPNGQGLMVHDRGKYDLVLKDKEYRLSFYTAYDSIRDKIISCGQGRADIIDTQPPYRISSVTDSTSPMFQNSRLIFSAVVDTSGDYWLSGRGIAKYNPDKKTFKYYTQKNKKLAAKGVIGLSFDKRGGLWAGTFSEGLLKYNPAQDRFEPVFEQYFKDRPTSFAGQMTERYFLVSDNINIYVIDLEALYSRGQEKVVKVLNHHNGFPGMEPGQNGFFKDSKGKIWITSSTVLSVLDPSALNFKTAPLHTYIRSINGERLPFNYESGTAIELTEGLNDVKIEVESVGEDKSAASEFSYRIPGFREEWSDWQTEPAIYLTNLPAGTYKIEIKSKHSLLEESLHPITNLSFKVSVPIHRSPVFYKYAFAAGTLLLFLLGLIWGRNVIQNRKLKKQQTKEEDLTRKLKLLQIQTTQAQLNPHFIFNVLQTLQGQILKGDKEVAVDNIVKLSHLIRSFLNASVTDGSVSAMEITLEKEIELLQNYIDFEKEQKDNFDYSLIKKAPLNSENFRVQPLLIQPFVENAIKHGFQDLDYRGVLTITFSSEDEEILICTIEDNGIGRDASREIQTKSIRKYKSVGTKVVASRIAGLNEIGYDISVNTQDRSAGGTIVTIRIDYKG